MYNITASNSSVNPNTSLVFEENVWCSDASTVFLSTDAARINLIAFCVASIISSLLTVVFNGTYIFIVLRNTKLRSTVNKLYILLSILDAIAGLSFIPVYLLFLIGFVERNPKCYLVRVWTVMSYTFIIMSVSAIALITIEIYLAIFKPFTYKRFVQNNTLNILLLVIWVPSVAFPIVCVYAFPNLVTVVRISSTSYCLIIFVILVICQKKIYNYFCRRENQGNHRRRKAARIALQILLVFGLCSFPAVMANVVNRVVFNSIVVDTYVNRWCNFLVQSYSVWDTFIYGFRSAAVKRDLKNLCHQGENEPYNNSDSTQISKHAVTGNL